MLTLQTILDAKTDLFQKNRVKLVRHKDSRAEYRDLIRNREGLLHYQANQPKNVFKDCDYIISFVGKERKRSIFFGVFKVCGVTANNGVFRYDLQQMQEFDYLNDRIVVNWGNNAIAWHQWYSQTKEIVEILPAGYLGNFPGLLDFVLNYEELQRLTQNPEANADWKHHLSAVNGVYIILDSNTGNQYIGSACGEQGIWQRWSEYARHWHGGNKQLKALYDQDPQYCRHFRYSVLQTLPSNFNRKEVTNPENLYKQKLGSRVHGLNGN